MALTDILKFPVVEASQAQKHVPVNEGFAMADALIQLAVKQVFLNTPPGSPSGGDRYIVGGSPTGAWAGKSFKIAHSLNGAWVFYDPKPGMQAYDYTTDAVYTVDTNFTWVPEFSCGKYGSVTFTDFSKTSDTTLAAITNLTATLGPGTYAFRAYLPTVCGASGGVKLALGGTALATKITADTKTFNGNSLVAGGAQYVYNSTAAAPTGQLAALTGVVTDMYVEGTITVTTAGTVTLRFAQNASNATPSTIKTDSRLQFQRII